MMIAPAPADQANADDSGSSLRLSQVCLFLVLLGSLAMEGVDVKILSFAAPQILAEWGVSKTAFSSALAAPLIGMAPGAMLGGVLGDRLGRRSLAIASTLVFGLCTLAMSLAYDLTSLTALRLVSGFGFGAVLPSAYALMVEWSPRRLRAPALSILTVATPIGGALSAAVVVWLLPAYGWRAVFMASGVATCLVVLAMAFVLPESHAFLLSVGKVALARREWARMMGKDVPEAVPPARIGAAAPSQHQRSKLFQRQWSRLIITSGVIFCSIHFVNYAVGSWLPVIMTSSGLALTSALGAVFAYNCCAVIGGIASVNVAQIAGAKRVLAALLALITVLLGAMPFLLRSAAADSAYLGALTLVSGLIGLGAGGVAGLISAVLSVSYPVDIRSTGVGFGVMWGRIGAIIAIVAGGAILDSRGNGTAVLFTVLTCVAATGLVAALIVKDKPRLAED